MRSFGKLNAITRIREVIFDKTSSGPQYPMEFRFGFVGRGGKTWTQDLIFADRNDKKPTSTVNMEGGFTPEEIDAITSIVRRLAQLRSTNDVVYLEIKHA